MTDKTDRMVHNLARMRELKITPDEANITLGYLSGAPEMGSALDLLVERRALMAAKAGS
jgi:hypothetical protein